VKSKDTFRLTAEEMSFILNIAKYTWGDHKTNEEILNELKVTKPQVIKVTGYNT
jgi:hypothetical protein